MRHKCMVSLVRRIAVALEKIAQELKMLRVIEEEKAGYIALPQEEDNDQKDS